MNTAPGAVFQTHGYLRSLQISQLSKSMCPWLVNCMYTLVLYAHSYVMKEMSIVNMTPVAVFKTLHFLDCLQLSQFS